MFSGAAPIPASSGRTQRYRLNRSADRQLNRALHTIVLTRPRIDPATRAYIPRRTAEGKTLREIKRSLKKSAARQFLGLLQAHTTTHDQHSTPPGPSKHRQQTHSKHPLDAT